MSTVSNPAATGGFAPLTDGDVARLRDRLIVECAHHAALANDYRAAMADLAGRSDVPSHVEREFAEAEMLRSNEAVIDIFNALLRIDAGVYGMCARCGGPIPPDRLDINPREQCCAACPEVPAQERPLSHAARSR